MASSGVDIGSLLAGLGSGGGVAAGDGQDSSGSQSIPDLLQQALQLIQQAYQSETDPIDKASLGKIMSSIDALFAQEQKDHDKALGGSGGQLLRRNR